MEEIWREIFPPATEDFWKKFGEKSSRLRRGFLEEIWKEIFPPAVEDFWKKTGEKSSSLAEEFWKKTGKKSSSLRTAQAVKKKLRCVESGGIIKVDQLAATICGAAY